MAAHAAFRLDRRMLEDEWTSLLGMALEADLVLCGSGTQLCAQVSAVRIVAVVALHQAFVHAMMEGLAELRLHFQMAGVAKLRLLLFHQRLHELRLMRAV